MPAIVWAAFIYTASSVPSGRLQWWLLHRFDKLVHLGIFYVLGLLVYRALHEGNAPSTFSSKRVVLMLIIVLGYGFFDEFHQTFTPGRSGMDLGDLIADVAGGALAAGTAAGYHLISRRRERRG
jgi:VanZ family protein